MAEIVAVSQPTATRWWRRSGFSVAARGSRFSHGDWRWLWRNGNGEKILLFISFFSSLFSSLPFRHRRAKSGRHGKLASPPTVGWETTIATTSCRSRHNQPLPPAATVNSFFFSIVFLLLFFLFNYFFKNYTFRYNPIWFPL